MRGRPVPARGIPFYNQMRLALHEKLPDKALDSLPRGYWTVGDILVLRLKPALVKYRGAIGKAVLRLYPQYRTVALEKSIDGPTRKPRIEVIAGSKNTQTLHKEHGCLFKLDLSKVMWSAGNKAERARLAKQVKSNEHVVDMFAGIGYWTVPAAKRAASVTAMDINPTAIAFLKQNLKLNRIAHKVNVLQGDCRELADKHEGTADRVIMGWLDDTLAYFPAALKIASDGATIHYHESLPPDQVEKRAEDLRDVAAAHGRKLSIEDVQEVKSMGPGRRHLVFDIKLD